MFKENSRLFTPGLLIKPPSCDKIKMVGENQKKDVIIMQTKTELARYIDQTEQDSAYDEAVKRVLSTKHLLAWIMKGCVAEYKDYSI